MGTGIQETPRVTVVIPHRMHEDASVTLNSLARGTFKGYTTVIVPDHGRGAQWARNEGFKNVVTEFTLFSDNDIEWKENALQTLVDVLDRVSKASYSYGRYKLGDVIWGHEAWDPAKLKFGNYVTTMSLVRTKDLPNPPFDEKIYRLQDWDLWLTMLEQGKRGVYVEDLIFETPLKDGISHNGMDYLDAMLIVKKKHGLD